MFVAKDVPPITDLFEWPALFGEGKFYEFNKIGLLALVAAGISALVWMIGSNRIRRDLVPRGIGNVVDALYDFIRNSIVVDIMGNEGLKYVPLLGSLFSFLFISNIFEVIPGIQLPVTSRMAVPAVLAIMIWVVFTAQGVASQGLGHYLKGHLFPPGVPKPIYVLLTPIELLQITVLRPFTLAVRVFANMVAGHVLLTIFITFCESFVVPGLRTAVFIPSFVALIALTGFEVFVSFIQAFIFTMLSAVYIGESLHGH